MLRTPKPVGRFSVRQTRNWLGSRHWISVCADAWPRKQAPTAPAINKPTGRHPFAAQAWMDIALISFVPIIRILSDQQSEEEAPMDLKAGSAVRRRSPVALFTRLRFADVAASGMTEMLVSGKKERVRARAGPNNIVGRAAQPRCVF